LGPIARPDARAHERIRRALDRVALLGWRQGVGPDELVLESDEDREAWAIFDYGRKRAQRGEGEPY